MSIIKKFTIGKHRLSVVIGPAYAEWLRPLEDLKNIRNLHETCSGLFAFMKDTRQFNISLDSSFHQEVKDCIQNAWDLSETLDEFLQNGLLNHFNYTIKVDLTMAFKPIEITVIDGKFSGKYDKPIGYQSVALSSFERNVGADEVHFLFSPNEFLRDPFITAEEAEALRVTHDAAMKDNKHSMSKMYISRGTLNGFLIPNDEVNRKAIKLLVTRVQNRWGKLNYEQREVALKHYSDGLFMSAVTKRHSKTMLLNNTTRVLLGVKPLLNALVNSGMFVESRLGLKVTLDQTNFVLAIV